MMYNFIIITESERAALAVYDTPDVALGGRLIDNAMPGIGININPDAANYEAGDAVPLAGCFAITRRMIEDPDYILHAPLMVAGLLDKPWCYLESETIFAPVIVP